MTELGGVDACVQRFRWMASERIPASLDLRQRGWILAADENDTANAITLLDASGLASMDWMQQILAYSAEERRAILVTGVSDAAERAKMIELGCGDVVAPGICLLELTARAGRVAENAGWLPRRRQVGDLLLDLLAREGYVGGEQLNLNPREFALIWRLSDNPNQPVSKQSLIHDVWRMGFVPETNSIAVHMSRLRRKLSFVHLEGIIQTVSEGYCLRAPSLRPRHDVVTPMPSRAERERFPHRKDDPHPDIRAAS